MPVEHGLQHVAQVVRLEHHGGGLPVLVVEGATVAGRLKICRQQQLGERVELGLVHGPGYYMACRESTTDVVLDSRKEPSLSATQGYSRPFWSRGRPIRPLASKGTIPARSGSRHCRPELLTIITLM